MAQEKDTDWRLSGWIAGSSSLHVKVSLGQILNLKMHHYVKKKKYIQ